MKQIETEHNIDQKARQFHRISVVRSVEGGWSEFAAEHDK
jgi:hypothetical protein